MPVTTAAVDDLTVLRTPREEWKFLCLFGRLSLNSLRNSVKESFVHSPVESPML